MPVLREGQVFERYRVIRWLGSGGAGESYEAEDIKLLRRVTLKLIHPSVSLADSARRQFFREIQGISVLTHAYLATVLDYGEIGEHLYVARRYVSSGSLLAPQGRLWFRPPLAVPDAFAYAHQLAQTLQYIHHHGYLHGSLTFSNVLVLREPGTEGIEQHAPFLLADVGLTNFVRRFGQPRVETLPLTAAPEQIGKRTTPASDQFALAVLLYFWLTGRPPYLGTPDEIEQLKLSEEITPVSMLNPGLTPGQDNIIRRALTVYPEERYPSILAFTEALQASLSSVTYALTVSFKDSSKQSTAPHTITHRQPNATQEAPPPGETSTSRAEEQSADPTGRAETSFPIPAARESFHAHPANEPGPLPPGTETIDTPLPETQSLPPLPQTPHPEAPAMEESLTGISNTEMADERSAEPNGGEPPLFQENTSAIGTQSDQGVPASGETSTIGGERSEVGINASPGETVHEQPAGMNETPADIPAGPVSFPDTQATMMHASLPRLIISSPAASDPYEFALIAREITIGRAGSSDLQLTQDDLTSRHHALIKREGEYFLLFDKKSYNGVFLNGQRIEIARGYELADGDHISIGNHELIFRSALGSTVSRV